MMNQATQDFIRQHQDDDVRQLAFLGSKYPEVDMPFALDQIRGRKMARVKLPRWASLEGIIYPPHISMEQCSSESTALYKAELAARLLGLPVSSSSAEKKMRAQMKMRLQKLPILIFQIRELRAIGRLIQNSPKMEPLLKINRY